MSEKKETKISITELSKNVSKFINDIDNTGSIIVLNKNNPKAVIMSFQEYTHMMSNINSVVKECQSVIELYKVAIEKIKICNLDTKAYNPLLKNYLPEKTKNLFNSLINDIEPTKTGLPIRKK